MKQQPNGIRPEEVERVLAAYGYVPARQKEAISIICIKELAT